MKINKVFFPILAALLLGSCSTSGGDLSSLLSSSTSEGGTSSSSSSSIEASSNSDGGTSSSSSSNKGSSSSSSSSIGGSSSSSSSQDLSKYPSTMEGAVAFLKTYFTTGTFGEYTLATESQTTGETGDLVLTKQNMAFKQNEKQIVCVFDGEEPTADTSFVYCGYENEVFYMVGHYTDTYAKNNNVASMSVREKIGTETDKIGSITEDAAKENIKRLDTLAYSASLLFDSFVSQNGSKPDKSDFDGKLTSEGYSITMSASFYSSKMVYGASFLVKEDLTVPSISIDMKQYSDSEWSNNAPISVDKCSNKQTATITITKKELSTFVLDLTPYFITKINKYSFGTNGVVAVGDVVTLSIDEFEPATALDKSNFAIISSSDQNIIAFDEASGGFVAKAEGECTLTIINSMADVAFEGEVTVTAASEPEDNPISVSDEKPSIKVGEESLITVTVDETYEQFITATSDDASIATVTVSEDMKTLTIKGIANGNANITVSLTDTKFTKVIPVYVYTEGEGGGEGGGEPTPTITFLAGLTEVEVDQTLPINVQIENSGVMTFSAASDNEEVLTVESVTEGLVIVKGVAEGTANITVTIDGTSYSKSIAITVTKKSAANPITLTYEKMDIAVGETQTVAVAIAEGTEQTSWTAVSSDATVLSIESTAEGSFTMKGIKEGTAEVTVALTGTDFVQTFTMKVTGATIAE